MTETSGASSPPSLSFRKGLADGLPIGLGYFAISIAFGLYAVGGGLPPLTSIFISLTNLTSSGQFAGVNVILTGGTYFELGLTVFLINLRYILMSLSLSQKLAPDIGSARRLIMGFGVTDEIFAVAMTQSSVGFHYFVGLMLLPICGWTSGTATGAFLGAFLPQSLHGAFGILLYAMFVAIIIPPAKVRRELRGVILAALAFSLALNYLPSVNNLRVGWKIIISTLLAAGLGATFFPIESKARRDDVQTGYESGVER